MTPARDMGRTNVAIALTLLGLGCRTAYVSLGDDRERQGAAGSVAGAGAVGGAGVGGIAGYGGGCAGIGSGAAAGSYCDTVDGQGCVLTEDVFDRCAHFLPASLSYEYHACLNAHDGIGGAAADQCEGYKPCSYEHGGCLYYYSGGVAGSIDDFHRCGEPGAVEWLSNCGGFGHYGPDITAGAGGAGGTGAVAGSGCDPAVDNCGGAGDIAGMTAGGAGGTAGEFAGTGAGGVTGGSGGAAGVTGGEGGS